MNRLVCISIVCFLMQLYVVDRCDAATMGTGDQEAKVKAAYLLNFLRFSTWPSASFADTEEDAAPMVVLVLGSEDIVIDEFLEAMIGEKQVQGREVVIQRQEYPSTIDSAQWQQQIDVIEKAIESAHMLYIDASMEEHINDVLGRAKDHTLTISDVPEFASDGGMLGLVMNKGRVLFEANTGALERSAVRVSAKVLRLARIVASKEET